MLRISRSLWLGGVSLILCLILTLSLSLPLTAQPAPLIEPFLASGKLADGETAMLARLKDKPDDDKARFSLGTVQVFIGIERLMQSLYRYGLKDDTFTQAFPILRLPTPPNKNPQVLTYDIARQVLQTWLDDLNKAQATLEPIKDPAVKLPLRFGMIKLDINGDGKIGNDEALWRIYARVVGSQITEKQAKSFLIAFDTGDALWLRGYCNALAAMVETLLAHNWQDLFEATGHRFFTKIQTPHDFLSRKQQNSGFFFGDFDFFLDVVAMVHLINFPVVEAPRLTSALQHLQTVLLLSRQSWALITAETDNDNEWIPNSKQKTIVPGIRVTSDMITSWLAFLDEAELVLTGKKLMPFWRGNETRGVNLNRVLTEPRPFDLVLWFQGSAATPYLEKGKVTDRRFWIRLFDVFQGQFFGFATWFN
ncbi:hypothetical protein BST81_21520 [Leptolyngbya sp. 'hensonii']|uniref:hypothetical protein n=1 Tax=Leptolyngbya sp. 'hensonii' TaxID=1922337 RepID=UPI00094F88E9|nr:hypothetical protein [Leptolyngbya sp. 'hensonii']OLP16371.1 hypothetical protein BST81_21520 [Leptolyngbya sp. 'hensonii']